MKIDSKKLVSYLNNLLPTDCSCCNDLDPRTESTCLDNHFRAGFQRCLCDISYFLAELKGEE